MAGEQHMDWTAKQGRILTGAGAMARAYVAGRDYGPADLPHHHRDRGETRAVFRRWAREGRATDLIAGAWGRPLFCGGWEEDGPWATRVTNVQTPTLFIDLRIPRSRPPELARRGSLAALSPPELRALARQHCFAGFSLVQGGEGGAGSGRAVCTRHHAIDWNPGPRRLPNKWRIEVKPDRSTFKEFCYARDEHGQAVYMERWQRLPGSDGPHLALSRQAGPGVPDGILVVSGRHFSLIRGRATPLPGFAAEAATPSLAGLVDGAVREGRADLARQYLDLECSAGEIVDCGGGVSWLVALSTFPWREGRAAFRSPVAFKAEGGGDGGDAAPSQVWVCGEPWEVVTCTFDAAALAALFTVRPAGLVAKL